MKCDPSTPRLQIKHHWTLVVVFVIGVVGFCTQITCMQTNITKPVLFATPRECTFAPCYCLLVYLIENSSQFRPAHGQRDMSACVHARVHARLSDTPGNRE